MKNCRLIGAALAAGLLTSAASAQDTVIDTFEDDTLNGWTFANDVKTVEVVEGGPCGSFVQLVDAGAGTAMVGFAPESYLGIWTGGDGVGFVSFDLALLDLIDGGAFTVQPSVLLIGPGGSAQFFFDFPVIGEWEHYVAPLDSGQWLQLSGTWPGMLADVTTMRLTLEFATGFDVVGFDNVQLTLDPPGFAADFDFDGDVDASDLAALLAGWGECGPCCVADLDGDGAVGAADLAALLAAWG